MNKQIIKISAFVILYLAIVPITITNATGTIKKAYYTMGLEKTKARIISSNVQTELKKGFLSRNLITTYRAHITYVYNVDRESYLGRGVEFEDPTFSTREEAESLVKKYPLNRRILIFYSTINPDKSVIIKPAIIKPLALIIIGALAGIYMTLTGAFFIMGGGIKKLKTEISELKTKNATQPETKKITKETKPQEPEETKTTPGQIESPQTSKPASIPSTGEAPAAEKTPAYNPTAETVKTGLKPKAKLVVKKPTANPLSTGSKANEAKPKMATTTSLKPAASKTKKPWYKF